MTTIHKTAAVGLAILALLLIGLIAAARHGRVVIARERAEAAQPKAEREILAGNQDVVAIPITPAFAERPFAAGQLIGWKIVDADLRPIPGFQRSDPFVYYDVSSSGNVSLFRGPYGPKNGDVKFQSGDAVTIKVSRPVGSKPLYLKIEQRWKPSSFGYYGGPLGNKRP